MVSLSDLMFGELVSTPLGPISFMAGSSGVQRVAFAPLVELKKTIALQDHQPCADVFDTIKLLLNELDEYLEGRLQGSTVSIDWRAMDGFQKRVLQQTRAIPYGEVLTYSAIAQKIGEPGAARAVGRALGANPLPMIIPCHRVIGSDHRLHGYLGGLDRKTFLLRLEGQQIEGNGVIV